MSYLERWWRDASDVKKESFTNLVQSGQLEIVSGGWVMNDEVKFTFLQADTNVHSCFLFPFFSVLNRMLDDVLLPLYLCIIHEIYSNPSLFMVL